MTLTLKRLHELLYETNKARTCLEGELRSYRPPIWAGHSETETEKAQLEEAIANLRNKEEATLLKIASHGRETPLAYIRSATRERLLEEAKATARRSQRQTLNRRPFSDRRRG